MAAPNLLSSRTIAAPGDLADFDLLPHPDWAKWFARADSTMPSGLRFAAVDYSIFELIADPAVGGLGVALLSPTLFRGLLEDGRLVAPLATVLKGPDWYFFWPAKATGVLGRAALATGCAKRFSDRRIC
ncbi:LysR substrate-binding domain-containing protein [Mesorhizobium salmacidum]|uniref:LysR substrate-binding domain-containing protein n=1 Tax=Mesorhizobium salmacidum TaxID=3015171 RepID=UPI0039F4C426